jgi:UDP-N-acetylmuramoyl-tripeptide--D-alanyl-D-alanine ligase
MLELGDNSLAEHQRIVDIVKRLGLWKTGKIILIGEMFNQLKESGITCFASRNETEEYLKNLHIESHTVLVKGSRGIGLESVLKYF